MLAYKETQKDQNTTLPYPKTQRKLNFGTNKKSKFSDFFRDFSKLNAIDSIDL